MKKVVIYSLFILILMLFTACGNDNFSNREQFNKYYQKNIDKCVDGMLKANIDSLTAIKKCECMLNTLYEIDSTFVRKKGKKLDNFIGENKNTIDFVCN